MRKKYFLKIVCLEKHIILPKTGQNNEDLKWYAHVK